MNDETLRIYGYTFMFLHPLEALGAHGRWSRFYKLRIFVTYSPWFCLLKFSLSKFLNILFFFMSFAAKWKGRVAVKTLLSRPKVKVRRAMMATLGMTLRLLSLLLLER